MTPSIERLALRQLADLHALTPGTYFAQARPAFSLEQAYAVQERTAALRVAHGEEIGGYKIGCLGPKIRQTFGMDGPIRGTLFENEFHRSDAALSCARYANLAIEGEMAVRIGDDGGAEAVFPVIELHHFVLRGEPGTLQELIANNALNAGAVLPADENTCLDPDATVEITINERCVDRVPLWGFPGGCDETLEWLTTHLAERGRVLKPGQIVLAGTQSDIYPVGAGDRVRVRVMPECEIVLNLQD